MKKKKDTKPLSKAAEHQANMLIAVYDIDRAEIVAKLTLQKIRAQNTDLKKKYGGG